MSPHKIWTFTHTFLKFCGCIQNSFFFQIVIYTTSKWTAFLNWRGFIPPTHTSSIVFSFQDALCFSEVCNIIHSHHSTSISPLMYNSPLSYKISCGCPWCGTPQPRGLCNLWPCVRWKAVGSPVGSPAVGRSEGHAPLQNGTACWAQCCWLSCGSSGTWCGCGAGRNPGRAPEHQGMRRRREPMAEHCWTRYRGIGGLIYAGSE